jgi:phthiocerol/phenolphthiocerol synthesis type-I polyketide synthase E
MADTMPLHAVAIIGLAGRFPGAADLDGFWRNIADGVECLDVPTDADLDSAGVTPDVRSKPNYVRRSTALDGAAYFDANFFGISPRDAQILDPQHRIFLECAWEALEGAGYSVDTADQAVGVFAGASMNTYLLQILRDPALVASVGGYQLMLGNDKDFLCTRVSYKLNLKGPSITIQTACSTSLVAVVTACQALSYGECDLALAGGVSVSVPERSGYLYEEGMIFSPDGHCRPFDAAAQGTRGSAGAGVVVLKRLADAIKDHDTIHAVIRGGAINNDGAGKAGYTAPSVDGQIEVIATAQALAGVRPREISYVEAHGTGTPLGDPIEIAALTAAFRSSTKDIGFCRLGSLKANLGHLDAAAGVASLIKTVLALKNRTIPPLVNFTSPNPKLDLARTPFVASAESVPWVSDSAPRRAGVSSFGIGGTNAHMVLEEAPAVPTPAPVRSPQLLVISAKTATALERTAIRLADDLDQNPERSLADVAWTLQVGRQGFAHRRTVTATTAAEAVARLRASKDPRVFSAAHEGGARPVAFLFSGQGSQYPGMGEALYRQESAYRDAVDRCAAHLSDRMGCDIREILFGDRGSEIHETRFTQPALFVTEYALACLWQQWGVIPKAMLGHSIGEYVAAHLAAVMSLEDALALVATRGRLMQACLPGAMAAVHLPPKELAPMLPEGIEIAAVNAAALCAVSGQTDRLGTWLKTLDAKGVKFALLKTSHAFHSSMMEQALPDFIAGFANITLSAPAIPYVSNLTGTWITPQEATSPEYYGRQLRHSVQFLGGIQTLLTDPSLLLLEVGPGTALEAMVRLTAGTGRSSQIVSSLSHPKERRQEDESILEAAGHLWLSGVSIDWRGLHGSATPARVPLPTYPFERERHWVEGLEQPPVAKPFRHENPADWLFAPTWSRDETPARKRRVLSDSWIVMARPGLLTDAILAEITNVGAEPILVEITDSFAIVDDRRFRVRYGQPDDLSAVLQHVQARHSSVRGAVYIWTKAPMQTVGVNADYHALVSLSEGLQSGFGEHNASLVVATFGAQSVLDEPVQDVTAALALGPVLVLPTETPGLTARLVDFEARFQSEGTAAVAQSLVSEAIRGDAENVIAWRGGRRWVRRYDRLALPFGEPADLPLKPRGLYLITGGLGGIGLTLAAWLAKQCSARLLLTGRTAFPPRADWERVLREQVPQSVICQTITAVREIEAAGGEVLTAQADAADGDQMLRAIELARSRWGEIDGVIHAAGIAGNGRFAFLNSQADVEAVLSPKTNGLAVLRRLLGDRSLDFVVLMSSINAVLGAPGACDYSAANAVLDAFVDSAERPAPWRNVIALDWAAWRDVGMAANMVVAESRRPAWQENLASGIPSPIGTELFSRVLAACPRRVVITPYNLAEATQFARAAASAADRASSEASEIAREVTGTTAPKHMTETSTESLLSEIWSELLGVTQIDPDADFFQLGGHSLLATRMIARVHDILGVRISLRDVFDAPTLEKLAVRINSSKSGSTPAVNENQEEREELIF